MPLLMDTHAHLDAPEYAGGKLEEAIAGAKKAGIEKIISVGCNEETSLKNIELSKAYNGYIYATYGFHPHNAEEFDAARHTAQMRECVKDPGVVAIGEIGLDYYRELSPRAAQKKVFLAQLAMARELDFPAVIHIRDAFDDFREFTAGLDFKGVIHCYSGNAEFAKWAVDKGLYISFTASVTYPLKTLYKTAEKTKRPVGELIREKSLPDAVPQAMLDIFAAVPAGRIMLETDCPYMAPQNLRGRLNEPANVRAVAEVISAVKDIEYGEFCRITGENALGFFRKIA